MSTSPTSSLYTSFNQDSSHFAVGLKNGFRVYTTDPLRERMKREFYDGGIGVIEMLERTNWIALVGGGREPKYPQNKVVMWDDVQKKPAFEMEFKSTVLGVRLRRDLIVVVLVGRVHVYRFNNPPHKLHTFETTDNERGLCALSPSPTRSLLAFPGRSPGHIQLVDLTPPSVSSSGPLPQHHQNLPTNISLITAHENRLANLAVNHSGTLLASASTHGTLLRIWDTRSCACLVELRRGVDRADIHSISFSPPPPPPSASASSLPRENMIAVVSDKGTIHVFSLASLQHLPPGTPERNKQSSFATPILGSLLPKYFQSRWGFAKASVPVERKEEWFKLGWWGEGEGVVVIGKCGGWWKFTVPKGSGQLEGRGGKEEEECKEVGYKLYLNIGKDG